MKQYFHADVVEFHCFLQPHVTNRYSELKTGHGKLPDQTNKILFYNKYFLQCGPLSPQSTLYQFNHCTIMLHAYKQTRFYLLHCSGCWEQNLPHLLRCMLKKSIKSVNETLPEVKNNVGIDEYYYLGIQATYRWLCQGAMMERQG